MDGVTQPIDPAVERSLAAIMAEHERRCPETTEEEPGDDTTTMRCNRDRGHFGATHVDRYGRRWRA